MISSANGLRFLFLSLREVGKTVLYIAIGSIQYFADSILNKFGIGTHSTLIFMINTMIDLVTSKNYRKLQEIRI